MRPRLSCLCLLVGLSLPAWASATPVIDAPSSLSFGNVVVFTNSNQTLVVGNTGNTFLSVTAIAISGADFSLVSPPGTPITLMPGQTVNLTVRFAPTSLGPGSGNVTISSSDPVTPTKIVSLSGSGVSAQISAPSPLAFGNVNVLQSGDLSLAISNTGLSILSVSGITITGADAAMFSFPTPPPGTFTLAPAQQVSYIVRFSPTSAGPKVANVAIASNDPFTPTKNVALTGTGIGPIITTTPVSLSFGSVHIAENSSLPVAVSNGGGGTLLVSAANFGGPDAAAFSLVSPPSFPIALAPGASATLNVRFGPATIGAKSAGLLLTSNDAGTPIAGVDLSGTGTRPEPRIAGVTDVPNDQGGRVKLSWDASTSDTQTPPVVDHYWIFRSVPPQAAIAAMGPEERAVAIGSGRIGQSRFYTTRFATTTIYWELLETVAAIHFIEGYSHITATLFDSTGAYNPRTLFMVMALDAGNTTHWDSAPDSGYSVDNLAPVAPAPFTAAYFNGATRLHWGRNLEADLAGYRLYRGASAIFAPGPANLVGSPPDTGFADPGAAGSFYKLAAVDRHGNLSPFALLTPSGTLDVPGTAITALSLAPPAPNPCPGEAEFNFALPEVAQATLVIYDGQGRRIRTVVRGELPAGRQSVHWNGRDEDGRAVRDGVYFAKLAAAGRTVNVRFSMLR